MLLTPNTINTTLAHRGNLPFNHPTVLDDRSNIVSIPAIMPITRLKTLSEVYVDTVTINISRC